MTEWVTSVFDIGLLVLSLEIAFGLAWMGGFLPLPDFGDSPPSDDLAEPEGNDEG